MKRIIKEASYITRCQYCDTEFTYQYSDTYKLDIPVNSRVVSCPNCGRENLHRDRVGRNRSIDIMHC